MKTTPGSVSSLSLWTAGALLNLLFALPLAAAISTPTGSLTTARASHTATLLTDGRVLVTGGLNSTVSSQPFSSAEIFDPTTGKWTVTGSMIQFRVAHTATLLQNGKVLVAGGYAGSLNYLSECELYDPVTGTWTATGSLNFTREGHTATLLADGRVLVAGGFALPSYRAAAEIYDPATGLWTTTGAGTLNVARNQHTATLLNNGKVMITGGTHSGLLASTEIFDPVSGSWTTNGVGSLHTARDAHSATLLPNGNVLVAGGSGSTTSLGSSEVFNPTLNTWTTSGFMVTTNGQYSHAATLLPSGQVLVSGGDSTDPAADSLATLEIYDPGSGTWALSSTMSTQRVVHTMTLLPSGRLLIVGGQTDVAGTPTVLASAEIFDYSSSTWTLQNALNNGRYEHSGTLLTNGQVLLAGGRTPTNFLSSVEIYDPASRTTTLTGPLNTPRAIHRAALLNNGRVLFTGGTNATGILGSCELYDPVAGSNLVTGAMLTARDHHTASVLFNGKVLVAGGLSVSGAISNVEIFDPAMGTWAATTPMHTAHYDHTATVLPDGRVLVACGWNTAPLGTGEIYDPVTAVWTTLNLGNQRSLHTATLMPDGKVILAGGMRDVFTVLNDILLLDPTTGNWSTVGFLQDARFQHTAVLLPNGKILFVDGVGSGTFGTGQVINTPELYDRATSISRATANTLDPLEFHTSVLLTNGDVLVSGGVNASLVSRQSLYDTGLNFPASSQPLIGAPTSPFLLGGSLMLMGAQFRGVSEGSSGASQTSSADHPVVQLRRVESGQTTYLTAAAWSSNSFASWPVTNFAPGPAMATMFVNGTPSGSALFAVTKPSATVTLSNLVQIYDGTAKTVTATTVPPGLAVTVTYNGSTAAPTNVGDYTVIGTINDLVYQGASTNTLQIEGPITRNFGVDVSHFQDASGIPGTNWAQMYAGGDRFAFVKGTEGLTGPDDATMNANLTGAMQAGLLAGVYHFAHPENRPTTNGAVQEADHLLGYAGSAIGPGFLRPVLDIETTSSNLPPAAMSDWVIAFSQEIIAHRGAGAAPIVYCSQFFANFQFDGRLAGYTLWLAAGGGDPGTGQPGTNGFPSVTGVFTNWSFWQYNVGSAGGISPIDLDVCHDEIAPLSSFLIPAVPAAAPGFSLQNAGVDSNGFHLSFTNVPGAHFTLLSATNVSLALSNWTVVGAATEVSPGQYQLVDSGGTNHPLGFYRVRSP